MDRQQRGAPSHDCSFVCDLPAPLLTHPIETEHSSYAYFVDVTRVAQERPTAPPVALVAWDQADTRKYFILNNTLPASLAGAMCWTPTFTSSSQPDVPIFSCPTT